MAHLTRNLCVDYFHDYETTRVCGDSTAASHSLADGSPVLEAFFGLGGVRDVIERWLVRVPGADARAVGKFQVLLLLLLAGQ